jgi:predicted AAA+ superfamily ATPase
MLRLLPLSFREIHGNPDRPLFWERKGRGSMKTGAIAHSRLWEALLRGTYPELIAEPKRDAGLWQGSYIQTYLERDVRTLRQVGDLGQFQAFLKALAARSGQLLNLAELSRDLGIVQNTVKAWISVLEATFQVVILRPYFSNIGKRLVKTPKVYFTDTGILCHLVGLKDGAHAYAGPMAGVLFETAVLSEIYKTMLHQGEDPALHFWRTSRGEEVDFIIESSGKLIPVEVKSSATPNPGMADRVARFRKDLGKRAAPGFLVHTGDVQLPLKGATAIPFSSL